MSSQASPNALSKFVIKKEDEEYRLHIEDETGATLELSASYEQLELLADTLDEILGADASDAEGDDEV